jgi:hypothetical protein
MIGTELLDDPHADPLAVGSELRDIARLNGLFGGTRAVVRALEPFFRAATGEGGRGKGATWTLLDVGTGLGDIPLAAAAAAWRHGITLRLVGVELNRAAAAAAQRSGGAGRLALILADGGALPLRPRSVDVVIVSQVLHHLPPDVAVRWIASFSALARRAVVLADLRRSRLAMAGVWLVSYPLGFGAVTRHDAVTSLRRGYTRGELNELLAAAGAPPVARYRPGFRVVAAWDPSRPVSYDVAS